MRTYSRNVRRAWDGDDYHAPKRQRLNENSSLYPSSISQIPSNKENATLPEDLEDNLERAIRETSVAALSSSPSRKNSTVFSFNESQEDENRSGTYTPPSSPPPVLQVTPPHIKARKPTFHAFDKNKKEKDKKKPTSRKPEERVNPQNVTIQIDENEPLTEILNSSYRVTNTVSQSIPLAIPALPTSDIRHTPTSVPTFPKLVPSKHSLVQTVLDLGQSMLPKTCPQCQMSYTPNVPEDVTLHDMYHNRNKSGIDMGKPFLKSAMKWCYEVPHIPGSVVVVDRKISIPARRAVQKVLEIINKELGSVNISEEDLWSQRIPGGGTEGVEEEGNDTKKADRYKVFMHIIDGRCVAVCLVERITKAYRTLPISQANSNTEAQKSPEPVSSATNEANIYKQLLKDNTKVANPSSSISISDTPVPAVAGISRIWTSEQFRRKGIANNLLECVLSQFIYGYEMEKSETAFSQPTESGANLARAWFGDEEGNGGWGVYVEE